MNAKTDQSRFVPLDDVLVRAPLLPVEAYRANAVATERAEWIDAAMVVGSMSLTQAAPTTRTAASRLRYEIRMATRPTPYGLFSGVGLARWGDATTLALADEAPRTHARPDMAWLLRLVMELESRPEIRKTVSLRANTAALIRGGRIMLAERPPKSDDVALSRVSVRATPVAQLVLQLARAPIAYSAAFEAVAKAAPTVTPQRIESLLDELLDQGLLITDLRPPLTCASPAHWLLERLAAIPAAQEVRRQIEAFLDGASEWDNSPACDRVRKYRELAAAAADLGAKPTETPLQVDTTFVFEGNQIRREIGEEVARAAELMLRLSPHPVGFPYLRHYRDAFVARYGENREVPLLELLDPYWGLGPPDPNAQADWAHSTERDQALMELACGALRDRRLSVELDEKTIARLDMRQGEPAALPSSLDVCAFVCARPGGVDRGEFTVVIGPNIGAPCAGRNMARFAEVLGKPGRTALQLAANAETGPSGALMAEIVYLPREFRLANVAIRPVTRTHEIALGVSPGVAEPNNISLDELTVSVENGRFRLRWPGRAERVLVTSSHMLNFLNAPPLCRFLAHMNSDERTQLHVFDWGPASRFPFLPRVHVGKAVLRPAEWLLSHANGHAESATADGFRAFLDRQRSSWQLPRHVYWGIGDVRLLLDLDDIQHIEQLRRDVHRLKPGMTILLQEPLPGLDDAWLHGPGGHYVVELVVSLARESMKTETRLAAAAAPSHDLPRMIPPGTTWQYLKLYGSPETEEDLLTGPVSAFLKELESAGLPHDLFFVRYSDPDPHLRLRFRTPTAEDADILLPELCAFGRSLMESEACMRFAIDTYEREIERYGGSAAIALMEDLFVADSALVVGALGFLKRADLTREVLAAVTVADLFDGFGLDEAEMSTVALQLRAIRQESGATFRKLKSSLLPLADNPVALAGEPAGQEFLKWLQRRREVTREVGSLLHELRARRQLTGTLSGICQSVVHMHCNRLVGRDRTEEHRVLGLALRLLDYRRSQAPMRSTASCISAAEPA